MNAPAEPRSDLETVGYVGGVAAVTAWGANAVILKFLTGAMPIAILNASRLLIASALFLLIAGVLRRHRGLPKLPARVWLGVAIAGIVGTSLYQYLFANGINLSSASLTAMVSSTNPVWIGIIGAFLGQRLSRWQFIGIPVTMLGVALLSWQSITAANVAPLGVALLILSNIAWAVYTITSRSLFKHLSPLEFTSFSFALGALPYLLLTLPEWFKPEVAQISSLAWGWVVLSAIVAQVVGFIGWFVGTEKLGAARVSVLLNITPVVGLLLAALVLGETLTPLKFGAIAVIFVGVYLANRKAGQ
jgi:drug/metabolite transporter (DMT)-like permease